jgi:tetratricopeptide (TPR) repeat protein
VNLMIVITNKNKGVMKLAFDYPQGRKTKAMCSNTLALLMAILLPLSVGAQLRYVYGEPFDSLYQIADLAYEQEDYSLAMEKMNEAFNAYGHRFPVAMFYQYAFLAAYRSGDLDKAVFYFDRYLSHCVIADDVYERLMRGESYGELRAHKEWPYLLSKMEEKRSAYGHVYETLRWIRARDQGLRQLLTCAREKYSDSLQHRYLQQLMAREDSINLSVVGEIIEEYGWLGNYQIGEDGNKTLMLVIQHADLSIQEKYFPLIQASVEKGETSASSFAFLVDRMQLYRGEYQVFGTQVIKDGDEYKVFPISEPANVDVRRAELGFEPLAEYLSFFGVKIDGPEDLQLDYLLDKWDKSN